MSLPNQLARTLCVALDHLERALQLLDASEAPPDIGAHLDLAIHRLRETVEGSSGASSSNGSSSSN
jgi:hypothetical protein